MGTAASGMPKPTMRSALYDRHGDVDELYVGELPRPEPAAGEALVRVRAAALNGFDPMMLQGTTRIRVPFPMVPCGDAAGEVAGFGPGTDPGRWREGDRAALDPVVENVGMLGEKARGVAREYVTVPVENLVPVPDSVSLLSAAAVPVAYGTAQRVVEERARIKRGETVLVLGATGGVGVCCVQLCKLAGATVIATGSGSWKRDELKELGADHVLPSRTEAWLDGVQEIAGRPRYLDKGAGGVDVVINYIGGDTWAASLKVLRYHGRMVTCGATAGYDPPTDIRYIWSFEQTILGSDGWSRAGIARLLKMVGVGDLNPALHAIRPLDQVGEAMAELVDRRVFGKSILRI